MVSYSGGNFSRRIVKILLEKLFPRNPVLLVKLQHPDDELLKLERNLRFWRKLESFIFRLFHDIVDEFELMLRVEGIGSVQKLE
jgi:hypothetical protein